MHINTGMILAGAYVALALYLIGTQGLFGESFIALLLGLPWSLAFSLFEYWNVEGTAAIALLLLPMALNAYLLYRLGNFMKK